MNADETFGQKVFFSYRKQRTKIFYLKLYAMILGEIVHMHTSEKMGGGDRALPSFHVCF